MKFLKRILLMTAMLGLVVGYIYYTNRHEQSLVPPPEPSPVQQQLLTDLSLDSLKRISIVRADGSWSIVRATTEAPEKKPSAVFDRKVNWQLSSPEGAPISDDKLRSIIAGLGKLTPSTILSEKDLEPDQSAYGLEPPSLVLTVHQFRPGVHPTAIPSNSPVIEEGKKQEEENDNTVKKSVFSFGSRHPVSGRRYLQIEGDKNLYLVENQFFDLLNFGRDVLRDTRVLPILPERITSLVAVRGENTANLIFKKVGGNSWSVSNGEQTVEADPKLINKLIAGIVNSEARAFFDDIDPFLALFGLKIPKLILGLTLSKSTNGSHSQEAAKQELEGEEARVVIQLGEGVGGGAIQALQKISDGDELNAAIANNSKGIGYYAKITDEPTIYELKAPFFLDFLKPMEYFKAGATTNSTLTPKQ